MRDSAEPDAECPVPIETLDSLARADAPGVLAAIAPLPEVTRVRLALYCYNRSHFRKLALMVASTVEPTRLAQLAGTMGEVLAAQCRESGLSFGTEPIATGGSKPVKPKPKISLGGRG